MADRHVLLLESGLEPRCIREDSLAVAEHVRGAIEQDFIVLCLGLVTRHCLSLEYTYCIVRKSLLSI
jgi:hypothetical protein